jgi:hypothetical protein
MSKFVEKLKYWIMYSSSQERMKRKLVTYKEKLKYLKGLDNDEIDLEYITLKTQYEHKKICLSIFMISIVLSFLMNLWGSFYSFVKAAIESATMYLDNGVDYVLAAFVFSLIVFVSISAIILTVLILYIKDMRQIYNDLLIIEEFKNKNNK